jgi:hypothetical protein
LKDCKEKSEEKNELAAKGGIFSAARLFANTGARRIHGSFDWKMEIEIPGRRNRMGEYEIHLRMSGLPRK